MLQLWLYREATRDYWIRRYFLAETIEEAQKLNKPLERIIEPYMNPAACHESWINLGPVTQPGLIDDVFGTQ